ncbi:hypothetical protein [Candidatus Soleaferrea massiliensis]|uniref:hypothetical protein n=1 Tax=Candidatus Soleaferrea massiliensis TaxID=1470354 RepID=UPI0012E06305|nr:hypothetical protein [Candidatus Soleaferrea massiliensis]
MKKSRTMKKIVAASCAGLLAIAMCIPSFAAGTYRNFWLDRGYNQGTSRSTFTGGETRTIVAEVRSRSNWSIVSSDSNKSYYSMTVTAPGSWNYSNYTNTGSCF